MSESWRVFRPPKPTTQNTTINHVSTTHLPSIHHTKTPKNPHITKQNAPPPRQKKSRKNTPAILPLKLDLRQTPRHGLRDQTHASSLRRRSHHRSRPPHSPQLRQLHRPLHPPRRAGTGQTRIPHHR